MDAMVSVMDVDPHSGKVENTHLFPAALKWAIVICILSLFGMVAVNLLTVNNLANSRRTKDLATATMLETAVNNFVYEYSELPAVGSKVTTDSPEGIRLLHILLGMEPAGDDLQNTRKIRFLSLREGDRRLNGLIYAADHKSVEGLFNPWGDPYTVEIDTDNDEVLEFKRGGRSIKLEGRRVAVYSPGKDGKHGTKDDVTTW